ncbi:Uma2 family endonuclease [bacterium]|nr:Uma2 family endonuclease [bacterium]
MSTTAPDTALWTITDLAERFGPMPAWRILSNPSPGEATEEDVERLLAEGKQLCELVDSILIRKTMGAYESAVGIILATYILQFVKPRKLGIVLGEAGMLQLWPGRVRIPDVCFISKDQLPDGTLPRKPSIPELYPDLSVEVLSESNTPAEMSEKLRDYFQAGSRLVWYIDPARKLAEIYTSPDHRTVIDSQGMLDAAPVLPGLTIPLADVFDVGIQPT